MPVTPPPPLQNQGNPRIAVLFASVGGGHGRAAEALALALQQLCPSARVDTADVLDFTNTAFRHVYAKTYFQLYARAPHFIGHMYDWLDRAPGAGDPLGDRLRRLIERANLRRFAEFLTTSQWDFILNTHFLPAELVALLRRRNQLRAPQATVTTDFETHRLWVNHPCEHYFTHGPESRAYLRHWGVSSDRISVTGIPIHPAFTKPLSKAEARRRLGLEENRPLVLQLAGGLGVGPMEAVFRALVSIRLPLCLAVVAGRNRDTELALSKIPAPARHTTRILGYTPHIDQWMAAADLAITKPGGLTSSECLARGLPMAIVHPIPGQESRNSDFLLESGAAIKINTLPTLHIKLARLLFDRPRLAALSNNALRAARPHAACDIATKTLSLIANPRGRF